jgi:CBS domain containing-hemolysin-like protein
MKYPHSEPFVVCPSEGWDIMIEETGPEVLWAWSVMGLLSVPALVVLNAFFVAAEFALVAVRKTRVEEMVRQGIAQAQTVQAAVANLDRSIAATQLGITLASIALGWVGEPALSRLLEPLLPEAWAKPVAVVVAFVLITFLHVVFGELIPKTLALQTPDRTSLLVAAPLNVFSRLARPFILTTNSAGAALLRWLGYQPAGTEEMVHSVDELDLLIDDTQEAGVLTPQQAEVVHKVFHLSDKRVRECMVPRDQMATLELHLSPDRVLGEVRKGAHTRMPVYEGALDNIVGVVNTKDLVYLICLKGVVVLEGALNPPLFLKPDETVADVLQLFRAQRRPLALVRDEQGSILGLITLEDVLEEIVGEIEDEHDRPTPKLKLRRKRSPRPKGHTG